MTTMQVVQAVRATRINGDGAARHTVCFAGLSDGTSVEIDGASFETLADRLRPIAFHEVVGWVDEVCSVKPVEFEVAQ